MPDPAFDFRKSRILYKISWEITSIIKGDSEEFSRIESLLNKIIVARQYKTLESSLRNFYEIVSKENVGVKQRRGIAYKLDEVLKRNENLFKQDLNIKFEKIKDEK